MTRQIAPSAATARENARTAAGQFGVQPRSEAELELAESPALDPMTWLPKPQAFGQGWVVVSESYDDDMEGTTTYRPDPATAAQLRELLGVTGRTPVRVQRHTVAPDDYRPHVDEIEVTAGGQEFCIDADYSGDSGVKLMELLAFRQTPPVAEQAAALAGARPGADVVVLRSVPTSDTSPSWDRATARVLGVEDEDLLVAPEHQNAFYRDRLPERIPLEKVGALDRAAAVKNRPALAWCKGYGSTAALQALDDADFVRMQELARAMPEEDWTYRLEVLPGDEKHGVEPTDSKTDLFGYTTHYCSYDFTTLDPEDPRDRWIIDRHLLPTIGISSRVAREVAALGHAPDETEIDAMAARMHDLDQRGAEYARRHSTSTRATVPRPSPDQYVGYVRQIVDDYLS